MTAARQRPPLVFSAPAAVVAAATILPLAYLALRAFGAEDFIPLLLQPRTLQVLGRSLALAAAVTVACVVLAVPLAWLTLRSDLPFRRGWLLLTTLPLVIPSYVGGFTVIAAFGPRGLLQGALEPLGVERLPAIYGFFGAWFTLTLFSYPYVLLTTRAALRGMNGDLEDVARSLGRSPRGVFRYVTLPWLRPAIAAGAVLVALYTLSDFGAVSLMRYDTFTRAIYLQYRGSLDRNLAAVLALVLVLIVGVLLLVEARTRQGDRYHVGAGQARRPLASVPLGRWRWPALALCAMVTLLGVVVPGVVIASWLAQGLANGQPIDFLWRPMLNSLTAAGLAAGVTVLAALPIALLSVRYPGRWSAGLEHTSYGGYALPPIVVALALVFFTAQFFPWLYQTLFLLVIAYALRFTPLAVAPLRSSLLQVSPHLEDAARGLGRSPLATARAVTLPLVRPGTLAGAALVCLAAMKELPATLLLSPIGFTTLATATWSAASEAFFARAAVSALLLVALSALSLGFVLAGERATPSG